MTSMVDITQSSVQVELDKGMEGVEDSAKERQKRARLENLKKGREALAKKKREEKDKLELLASIDLTTLQDGVERIQKSQVELKDVDSSNITSAENHVMHVEHNTQHIDYQKNDQKEEGESGDDSTNYFEGLTDIIPDIPPMGNIGAIAAASIFLLGSGHYYYSHREEINSTLNNIIGSSDHNVNRDRSTKKQKINPSSNDEKSSRHHTNANNPYDNVSIYC